jgi:hypothetical protein
VSTEGSIARELIAKDERIADLIVKQDVLLADLIATVAELKTRLAVAASDNDAQKQISAEEKRG